MIQSEATPEIISASAVCNPYQPDQKWRHHFSPIPHKLFLNRRCWKCWPETALNHRFLWHFCGDSVTLAFPCLVLAEFLSKSDLKLLQAAENPDC